MTPAEFRRKRRRLVIILAAVVAVAIGAAVFVLGSGPVRVTINGQQHEFEGATTVAQAVAVAVPDVVPGDYVAVDGTVLAAGKGNPFDATLNGSKCEDGQARLHSGDILNVANGSAIVEEYDAVESPIAPSISLSGSGQFAMMVKPGVAGTEQVMTGRESGRVATKTLTKPQTAVVRKFAPAKVESMVALTFDDGPSAAYTQQILDILAQKGAKATFFVDGRAVEENPALVKAIVDGGHQVAIHAFENRDFALLSDTDVVSSFTSTHDAILQACEVDTGVMRAPFLNFSSREWSLLGDRVTLLVGASIDSHDLTMPGVDAIVSHVVEHAAEGDIIVLHDGGADDLSQTVEALPALLDGLAGKGLVTVTIDELFAKTEVPEA